MARGDDQDDTLPPYRIREVAKKWGLSEKAVRDAVRDKRLPAFRIGRAWLIPREAVDRLGREAAA